MQINHIKFGTHNIDAIEDNERVNLERFKS